MGVEGVAGVDAKVGEGAGQVASAVAPTESRVAGLVRVQWGGQRRGKVQAGQVWQGTPCVQRRGDVRGAGLLVWGGEDAVGTRQKQRWSQTDRTRKKDRQERKKRRRGQKKNTQDVEKGVRRPKKKEEKGMKDK